eukprot:CAMPEP_0117659398 /NCGR_PEP_ID=MMETSP0804-20121206/6412_1 /TAXON_ID=1074897 /ORGANISM="Tetraselmis astigmatica, Strain CCMP880" /LENGTH=292 /DNA_ID=CAMNT_0005466055 /DNA_START=74 /DNA_END=952 /DNA_ORIENTATION=-
MSTAACPAPEADTFTRPPDGSKRLRPSPPVIAAGLDVGMEPLIKGSHKCLLKPVHFFVSWHGVLTLVYSGFPPPLVMLKQGIMDAFPSLPAENPGSKWPKTSLGCLKEGKRLSPEDLTRLNRICTSFSRALQGDEDLAVTVDILSIVMFQCCSLETRFCEMQVELSDAADQQGGGRRIDEQPPSAEELACVDGVVGAASRAGYWYFASKDGNDEKHYRGPHHGVTLVHPLQCTLTSSTSSSSAAGKPARMPSAAGLPELIEKFRAAVDEALPDMYTWFSPASLHVTIRGLMG